MSAWEQVVFRCSILIKVCLPSAPVAHHFNTHFKHTKSSRRERDSQPRSILYKLSRRRLPQALLLLPTTPPRPVNRLLPRLGPGTVSTRLPPLVKVLLRQPLKLLRLPASRVIHTSLSRRDIVAMLRSPQAVVRGRRLVAQKSLPQGNDHDLTRNHHGFKCCCHQNK